MATGAPLIDFDSGTVVGSMPATSEEEFVESATVSRARGNGAATATARAAARCRWRARSRGALGSIFENIAGSGPEGLITAGRCAGAGADTRRSRRSRLPRRRVRVVPAGATTEPLRGARRAMAHSMSLSRDQIPLSTVCDDADIHAWSRRGDYMLRLMRAMISAWRAEPALNAWYDSACNSRILLEHIDLAIAVDTPGGLIVPVLRNIQDKTPDELRRPCSRKRAPPTSAASRRRICATSP